MRVCLIKWHAIECLGVSYLSHLFEQASALGPMLISFARKIRGKRVEVSGTHTLMQKTKRVGDERFGQLKKTN